MSVPSSSVPTLSPAVVTAASTNPTNSASSLTSLSSALSSTLASALSKPIPLWVCVLTSLTSLLALRLSSLLSHRSRLRFAHCAFHHSIPLSHAHFRQAWLLYDVDRSGRLTTEECRALLEQLSHQASHSLRLQSQYVQDVVRPDPSVPLSAGVTGEATEVVRAMFERMHAHFPLVFAHFMQHMRTGQVDPALTPLKQPHEEIKESKEDRSDEAKSAPDARELTGLPPPAAASGKVLWCDYRSLCLLYGCYVEQQLTLRFVQHFRMTQ